ncbi:MAG: hypothetical protein PHW32_00840 [Bacilli bacterium]|nr:hypothetical protein [Bacilli bacterium]MDD4283007.1 hypothetical protein [Bacilli bacterium]MDD4718932.1 hypothetical protein [Bacilli bacterium]
MKKILLLIIGVIILISLVFGIIDYRKITHGEQPLFMVRITEDTDNLQKYIGLGYTLKRDVSVSFREPFYLDNEIRVGPWFLTMELPFYSMITYNQTFDTSEINNCNNEPELYYKEENRNIYIYCLNSFTTRHSKKDFKDYITNNEFNTQLDDFIEGLIFVEENENIGYKIYREPGKAKYISDGYTNNGLTIIKCSTKEGNQDIYIGPKWMEYNEVFCNYN